MAVLERELRFYSRRPQELMNKYKIAKKNLKRRNPLAHHVVSSSLDDLMFELQEGLEFIVCGIQKLFGQRNQNIILFIKRLKVLAARFECYLTSKSSEDASSLLYTDFTFLNMILTSKSPRDLPEWYMTQDAKNFGVACVEDILSPTSQVVRRLRVEREALQKNVRKCVTVKSDLGNFVGKVVEHLEDSLDYSFAVALLFGLKEVDARPVNPSKNGALIDENDNYAYLREKFCGTVEFPFVDPFLEELRVPGSVASCVSQMNAGCSSWETVDLRSGFEEDEKKTKRSILGFLRVCFPYSC